MSDETREQKAEREVDGLIAKCEAEGRHAAISEIEDLGPVVAGVHDFAFAMALVEKLARVTPPETGEEHAARRERDLNETLDELML